MSIKTSALILVISIFTLVANGAEKIEGAFGLKLGATFIPTKPAVKIDQYEGYEFTPEMPNPAFSSYLVYVSPTSHLIYKIVAISAGVDKETNQLLRTKILAVVSRKYEDAPTVGEFLVQGSRALSITAYEQWRAADKWRLAISYDDRALEHRALEESHKIYREEMAKDVDATGL